MKESKGLSLQTTASGSGVSVVDSVVVVGAVVVGAAVVGAAVSTSGASVASWASGEGGTLSGSL